MSVGLSESTLKSIVARELASTKLTSSDIDKVATTISKVIHKNNQEIKKELDFLRALTGK